MAGVRALERAVSIAGGQSKLAGAIHVSQQRLWWWLNRSKTVPGEYVLAIESATDGMVTRHDLRPDLYPKEVLTQEVRAYKRA